jgi:hypothetical protein
MGIIGPTHTLRVYMVGEQMGDDDDDDGGSWLMSCLLTNVKLSLIFTSAVKVCVGVEKDKIKYKTRMSNSSTWLDLLHAEEFG